MLSKEKLNRLNDLAKKAKQTTLSDAEQVERDALRREYLDNFREGFREHLDRIHVVDKNHLSKPH